MGRMTDHAPRPPRPTPLGRTTGHNHVDRHLQLHWRQRMVRPLMGYCTAIRWKIVDDCVQQHESHTFVPSHTNTHSSQSSIESGIAWSFYNPKDTLGLHRSGSPQCPFPEAQQAIHARSRARALLSPPSRRPFRL